MKKSIIDMIQKNIDVYKVAGWGLIDDVIDPRDTRRAIAWGLELAPPQARRAPREEARRHPRLAQERIDKKIGKIGKGEGAEQARSQPDAPQ